MNSVALVAFLVVLTCDKCSWSYYLGSGGTSNSHADHHKSSKASLVTSQALASPDLGVLKLYLDELRDEMQAMKTQLAKVHRNSKIVRTSLKDLKSSRCHDKEPDYTNVNCPYGFDLSTPSSCYKFMPERVTWTEAMSRCSAMRSHVVALESDAEQRLISGHLTNQKKLRNCDVWTAATDSLEEGTWRWNHTGNRVVTSHWHTGEPNNSNGQEDCGWMDWYFNWAWNDASCDRDKACFVCEVDM